MKKIILPLVILVSQHHFSQTSEPPTSVSNPMDNIKQLFPAAPTANNLMKFEEVPVSNYTGIPDIKIPIAGLSANNSPVSVNVSLNYHPLNAKPDDKSSEVGLGWSLFAGGSITRTVRGTPDDQAVLSGLGGTPTIGIYFDEFTSRFTDKNYTRKYLDAQATGIGLDPSNPQFKKLFYEAAFINRYDTEYDLYQYNFMGQTGRFIIKKNSSNQLFAEKLDKNNLKITIITSNPDNSLEATAFVITDEMGNKYNFDVVEKSTRSSVSNKVGFRGYINTNESSLGTTISAFHLSKVTDASDQELVKLNYYPSQEVFYTDRSQIYRAMDIPLTSQQFRFDPEIPAAQETNITQTTTGVRILQNIEVPGKGKINFTYLQGRQDSNFTHPQQLQKLDKISITDFSGNTLESYQFSYDHFTYRLLGRDTDDKRLSLTKITKYNSSWVKEFDYSFDYYQNNSGLSLGKDHWGWFNCVKPTDNYLLAKEPSASCMPVNVLKSMKLPSGGVRVFDFGGNTYSYVGNQPIDPYQNPENWVTSTNEVTYLKTENNVRKYFFTIDSPQTVDIQTFTNQISNYAWSVSFFKKVGNNYIPAGSIGPVVDPDPSFPQDHTRSFEAGEYYTVFNVDFTADYTGTVNFAVNHKTKKTSNLKQYLVGGGIRVNSISYFDKPGDANPSKKIDISYYDATDISKSSGALIFPKPVHHYTYNYANTFVYKCTPMTDGCKDDFSNTFTIYSSENFLPVQKTQGADVGYQRVKVWETGKGESIFTYKSPIDTPNPEQMSAEVPPFAAIGNYDYKRGLLIDEKRKDNSSNLLYQKNNLYSTSDTEKLTGLSLRHMNSPYTEYLYASYFKTYETYLHTCVNGFKGVVPVGYCAGNGGEPSGIIAITPSREIVGRANQNHSETTEYFGGKTLKTYADITFNTRDYPLKQTVTSSDSKITETSYQYAHEKNNTRLINANMIGIPLETSVIEKENPTDSGTLVSKSETKYDDASHLFPSSAISYNLQSGSASTQVTFDQYDSKGNLLQYTTKDGMPASIIWGYNGTQPIAKIEGAVYDNIKNNTLITAIINASNSDAANPATESSLITALDALRNDVNFKNFQMATFTYDPLIGVTTLTPPSGIREIYKYDSANRLEKIVDEEGKILKEYQYNYKP